MANNTIMDFDMDITPAPLMRDKNPSIDHLFIVKLLKNLNHGGSKLVGNIEPPRADML